MPPSINLLTPVEPLTEADDVVRAMACDAGEENMTERDSDYDCDIDNQSSNEVLVSVTGESSAASSSQSRFTSSLSSSSTESSMNHTHLRPRLSITMPSSHVVEISQTFYWPLHSKPIDWIYQDHVLETCSADQLEAKARRIAVELQELQFFQAAAVTDGEESAALGDQEEGTVKRIMRELTQEKEDWFSDLSGGQKSKVELVRKVFMHDRCPDVLLIDETMAPLDPASKSRVMAKLKRFCNESIMIVIYHTDVGQGKEVEGKSVECVPSNDFFDKNIHLEKGVIRIRDTC